MIEINGNPSTQSKGIKLLPVDSEFIERINNRLTLFGQLAYTIPEKMIIEVIKNSARFFYKWYPESKQRSYYYILKKDIEQFYGNEFPDAKASGFRGYAIRLHPKVSVVINCFECNSAYNVTSMDIIDNMVTIQRNTTYNNSLLGINNNLWIQEAAVKMVEYQAMESIFKADIPFDYNPLTKIFLINRTEIKNNLVIETESQIDIQYLYNDNLFERHVIANSKKELKRLLASHTIQLPGDTIMNTDEICAGTDDAEIVEQLVKGSSGIGDIILMR